MNCPICGNEMNDIFDEDSRQEWYQCVYACNKCEKMFIHRREFNQLGLVINDTLTEEVKE